jgi:poly(glycerol-phosphate) alpha-glucosyltransferase
MLDPWALKHSRLKKAVALRLFERSNLAASSVMHALNLDEARHIRALGLRNPIAIIPNGVTIPSLPRAGREMAESKKTLLFLGRIHPKKGLRELLAAWEVALQLSSTLRNTWQLQIAGWDDGNHLQDLISDVRKRALEETVLFSGPLFGSDKDLALRSASAFILPSFGEGLPLAVLEAWAYALPVLMTRECNLAEGFVQGAAIEIPSCRAESDIRKLANTLVRCLAANASTLGDLGTRGRAFVESGYTWDSVVDRYAILYAWVRDGGPTPEFVVSGPIDG